MAEVTFSRSTTEEEEVLEEIGGADALLFLFSLTLFELPNHRLFRARDELDGVRLLASASASDGTSAPLVDDALSFAFSNSWVSLDVISPISVLATASTWASFASEASSSKAIASITPGK